MIYPHFELKTVSLLLGVLLVACHLVGLLQGQKLRPALKAFPRSRVAGGVLMTAASLWFFLMVKWMDLGEFSPFRPTLLVIIPIACVLAILFIDDFLAVRALGMLLLLAAEPVLETAFLRPETSRLLIVLLAYAWATIGMFWVGMPYLMRDGIDWLLKSERRWQVACLGGIVYGAVILISPLILHR